jgi:hypothetical protein
MPLLAVAQDPELPPPPKGYTWQKCPDIKGAFLRPNGWHFKKHKQGDTLGYFITKENIKETGEFLTGMTVNVIPNIPKKKSMSPYKFAESYRDAARTAVKFSKEWDKDMGPFRSLGFVVDKQHEDGQFRVHHLLIANEKTGTLYLVLFEAPVAEWDAAWKIAEPMLQFLYIDDTI